MLYVSQLKFITGIRFFFSPKWLPKPPQRPFNIICVCVGGGGDLCKSDWRARPFLPFHGKCIHMLDSFQCCLGWKCLPPTEASICKPVQWQNSTALYSSPLHSHNGARSKSKDSKHNWHFEREKEVETKVNGNIRRLPPETCLSSTISCPIFFGHLF